MPFVPGYAHDIFVSYAHGDDRPWIDRLIARLEIDLKQRLGVPVDIWIDKDDLRKSTDFSAAIPTALHGSATFLFFPSPSYVRSAYCVRTECDNFERMLPAKRARTKNSALAHELFAVRCPILPVPQNAHWQLINGLTDISFCDANGTFSQTTPEFEVAFRQLTGQLLQLLQLMRNDRTPVFVYPPNPADDVAQAHEALVTELGTLGYRVVPEGHVRLKEQLLESALAIFLLGKAYDESVDELTAYAALQKNKPWVLWQSADASSIPDPAQAALLHDLRKIESASKTDLEASEPASLKAEVLELLKPDPVAQVALSGKPRIYLVCNTRDEDERLRAGLISRHFRREFNFEWPGDWTVHSRRLRESEGVLLVWGSATETTWGQAFAEMVQSARRSTKGLCLIDPKGEKETHVSRIRAQYDDIHIAALFEPDFDPSLMQPFFRAVLSRRDQAAAL